MRIYRVYKGMVTLKPLNNPLVEAQLASSSTALYSSTPSSSTMATVTNPVVPKSCKSMADLWNNKENSVHELLAPRKSTMSWVTLAVPDTR